MAYLDDLYNNTSRMSTLLNLSIIQNDSLDIQLIKSSFTLTKTSDDPIKTLTHINIVFRSLDLTTHEWISQPLYPYNKQ